MRLLHTRTLKIHSFLSSPTVPYAILSHTWGPKEVTLQDMSDFEGAPDSLGSEKVVKSCAVAHQEGFEYIWIDTCCIDKTNHVELSEALNSMFRWYKEAATCYAYLEDVETGSDLRKERSQFRCSRWFMRGWTLQELLAPDKLIFYSESWEPLGSKLELCGVISEITRISEEILQGGDLSSVCVAQKMSWVSCRRTTRMEDIAYCLLGIFDINMPLLYGEGEKSFLRLQEEILKTIDDESIFAWKAPDEIAKSKPFHGLLATSPAWFKNAYVFSHPLVLSRLNQTPGSMTSRGLHTELLLIASFTKEDTGTYYAMLNCRHKNEDLSPAILLQKLSDIGMQYARIAPQRILLPSDGGRMLATYSGREKFEGDTKLRELFVHQNPCISLPVSAFYWPGGGNKVSLDFGLEILCTDTYPASRKYGFTYQDGRSIELAPTQNSGYLVKATHRDITKLMKADQSSERPWFTVELYAFNLRDKSD